MYDSKITYRMNYSINQRQSSRPKRDWDLGKDKNKPSSTPSASFFEQNAREWWRSARDHAAGWTIRRGMAPCKWYGSLPRKRSFNSSHNLPQRSRSRNAWRTSQNASVRGQSTTLLSREYILRVNNGTRLTLEIHYFSRVHTTFIFSLTK